MPIQTMIKAGISYIEITGIIDYDIVIKQIDYTYSLKDKIVNRYELHDHTNTEELDLSADDISKIAVYGNKTKKYF